MLSIAPTQSNVQAALIAFLQAVLPTGMPVISGQQNRAAEPTSGTFAVVTPLRFDRLATNVDSFGDVKFTGSISGVILTVTAVQIGILVQGATIFGPTVSNPMIIITQLSGPPGSTGTYQVSNAQTVSSGTLSAGGKTMTQNAEVTIQIDFHSADLTGSDMAQTVSTALRDEYSVNFFAGLAPPLNGVVPLYADNPRQVPFINDQQQWEWRWSLDCCLQVDQTVAVPQEYTDGVAVTVKDVSALFPP